MLGLEGVEGQLVSFYTSYPRERRHDAGDSRRERENLESDLISVICGVFWFEAEIRPRTDKSSLFHSIIKTKLE